MEEFQRQPHHIKVMDCSDSSRLKIWTFLKYIYLVYVVQCTSILNKLMSGLPNLDETHNPCTTIPQLWQSVM